MKTLLQRSKHLAPAIFRAVLTLSAALLLTLLGTARPAPAQPLPGLALPGITGVSSLFDLSASPQDFPTADGPVHEEWNRRFHGPVIQSSTTNGGIKVAIDKEGNVYVAGDSDVNTSVSYSLWTSDYRLVKYAPDGTELWNRRYDDPAHGYDSITGLALDAAGDAYVTGNSRVNGTNSDWATLKYAPNGDRLWVRRYDDPAHGYDYASAIAVDAAGDAYVTGYITSIANQASYATFKYAPDGTLLWVRQFNGEEQESDAAYAITVASSGNVVVTGNSRSFLDDTGSALTLEYSPDGDLLWNDYFNDDGDNDTPNTVATDASGNVYIGATSVNGGLRAYYLTLKYAADGSPVWHKRYSDYHAGVGYPSYSVSTSLALDPSDNVLVTGNVGTVKYGKGGTLLWVQDNQDQTEQDVAVVTDAAGCVYVVGTDSNAPKKYKYYPYPLTKYGPDGRLHWKRNVIGPANVGPYSNVAQGLAIDAAGDVYVTGSSRSSMRTIKFSQ